MMSTPRISYTDELHQALEGFAHKKAILVAAGIPVEVVAEFVEAVRQVDAEVVAARHVHRNGELYPYYSEGYQAEEDGLEDAERLLRASMPEMRKGDRVG